MNFSIWERASELFHGMSALMIVALFMFVLIGPIIEIFLDIMLPPENWDDDDTDAV